MARMGDGYSPSITMKGAGFARVLEHLRTLEQRMVANTVHDTNELAALHITPAIRELEAAEANEAYFRHKQDHPRDESTLTPLQKRMESGGA